MRRGQPRAARDALERALAETPDEAILHALLALCHVDLGNKREASMHADLARSLEPNEPTPLYAAGAAQMLRGRFRDAEKTFLELVELDPDDAWGPRALADLYRVADYDDWPARAEPLLARALELAPDDVGARVSLGRLELARGRRDEAGRRALEALEAEPEHAGALVLMGEVALARGEVDEARACAVSALRSDPEARSALELLVATKIRSSRWLAPWWWLQSRLSWSSLTRKAGLAGFALALYASCVWWVSDDPGFTRGVHATFWGLALYLSIGNAVFEGAIERETAGVHLRGEF